MPQFEKKDLAEHGTAPGKNINDAIAKEPIISRLLDEFKGEII